MALDDSVIFATARKVAPKNTVSLPPFWSGLKVLLWGHEKVTPVYANETLN